MSGKLVAKNVISFLLRPVNPFAIKANNQCHGVKCNRPVLVPIQLNSIHHIMQQNNNLTLYRITHEVSLAIMN
jgi:hypothetical protein